MKRCGRRVAFLVAALAATAALVPASASATITSVFGGATVSTNAVPCTTQTDGVRVCHGDYNTGPGGTDARLYTWEKAGALEAYVILPPAPGSGSDGPYPLVVQGHGWGGSAGGPNDTQFYGPTADSLAKNGYAVLQLTSRGFGDSCGKSTPPSALGPCANGYIRLDDDRYEVRDVQNAIGLLVDEGVVDPNRVGATGESYGGGLSMALATLKDRVYDAGTDSLQPWTSPGPAHTPIHIAAAVPVIPWSDLAYSLLPNGRTLDYQVTPAGADTSPFGVEKQSFVSGLYALGQATGTYAPPGTNGQADLTSWYAFVNAGEPYEANSQAGFIATQITKYHSSYYLLDGAYTASEPPAPLLISNGFTDDLFPVDEAVRYYNYVQARYPSNPIALLDGDFGHMRAQNKSGDKALLSSRIQSFFDHYVKGSAPQPPLGATATIETCPASAASGGPYSAATWSALHPGEVDYDSNPTQTINSNTGDPAIAKAIDPVAGGGACATVSGNDQGSGVATYRLPRVTGSGYTLLGSPTVIANLNVSGNFGFIAARLWDVDLASNTQTLVARGLYRLDINNPDGFQAFQTHPGGWHFAAGHVPKLELLGQDSPYARTSNGQFSIQVSNLELRLPVHEIPGSPGTPSIVTRPKSAYVCVARPHSRIARRRTHASRSGIVARGTAGEYHCAGTASATRRRQRVARVYVMIYRGLGHGRCRFLTRTGKLSRPRSCKRPIEFRARGTSHWTLRLHITVPPGRYLIRADAVDRQHHHQQRSAASTARARVR